MEKNITSTRSERRRAAKAIKKKQKKLKKNSLRMLGKSVRGINPPSNMEKMSDILNSYAEPLMEDDATYEQMNVALGMAAIFWNVALLSESEENPSLSTLIDEIRESGHTHSFSEEELMIMFKFMIERKQQLFPDEHRLIIGYELTDLGNGDFHIDVASRIPSSDL